MEFDNVTQIAFFCAAVFSFALTLTCVFQTCKAKLPLGFAIAALVQTGWLAAVTYATYGYVPQLKLIAIAEISHYLAWIIALIFALRTLGSTRLPKAHQTAIISVCAVGTALALSVLFVSYSKTALFFILVWSGIVLALVGLLCTEQLYRNTSSFRLIKLLCLNLFIIFLFDLFIFTQHLFTEKFSATLWQARASVSIITSVLMGVGALALVSPKVTSATVRLSRPAVFYSSTLAFSGTLFVLFALGGYYVQNFSGSWGTVIYSLVLAMGSSLLIFLYASRQARETLNVLINKHLFSYKYDYRAEWLQLIEHLSQPTPTGETYNRALAALADIFKCESGALWLKRGKVFVPTRQNGIPLKDISETFEPCDTEFCKLMEEEQWIFCLQTAEKEAQRHLEKLPAWIKEIEGAWLAMPLICDNKLIGFAVLADHTAQLPLNWEDLDLVSTVGRQVASYIERHEQSELLAESRQFEAFNKLSAYVMHDLKNLIAQQSLVVSNAEKHKDNPAFVEDVINTINNSVNRMSNLLRKLQHNEPEQAKTVMIKDVLLESVKRCQKSRPMPTLMNIDEEWQITADPDSLNMTFTHIIQNAQDATPAEGYVDISAHREDNMMYIRIEDNGEGMDQAFIQNRLFKPFETTKSGKGMGIGVFQARDYIQSLKGNIVVDSTLGEGTTFIISLPLLPIANETT